MFSMKPDPELILASIGLGVSGEGIIGGNRWIVMECRGYDDKSYRGV